MTTKVSIAEHEAGPLAKEMREKLLAAFAVEIAVFENESGNHAGPATDSHFKLLVVSNDFAGLNLVKRHQAVYSVLNEFLANQVHALSLHLFTPEEWVDRGETVAGSPACRGASGPAGH